MTLSPEFAVCLLLAYAGCTGALAWLARRGQSLGLLDHPGGRKQHTLVTPRVGGLGMAAGLAMAGIFTGVWPLSGWLTAGLAATLVLGLLDDRTPIPARSKLIAQVLIAVSTVTGAGIVLPHVGELIPGWVPTLGWLALPLTVFGVVSVMNAINMADGLDGLAGSLSLTGFAGLGFAALVANHPLALMISALAAAVIVAFLGFNLRLGRRKSALVFMGDAGSLAIGYLLAVVALMLCTHPSHPVPPAVVLWAVALPLLDGLSVMVARRLARRPLTQPGRDHLHHQLLNYGFSVNQIVLFECLLALSGVTAALTAWLHGFPDWLLTVAFVALAAVYLAPRRALPAAHQPVRVRSGSPSSRSG